MRIVKRRVRIMNKYLRLMAALSVFSILTVITPAYANSFGWVKEDGIWKFYTETGYPVKNTWKKYANDWYYLNAEGEMATEAAIDNYYVDAAGKLVLNQWIAKTNPAYQNTSDSPKYFWKYYGNDGKLTTSTWKLINGYWYSFNEKGTMRSGIIKVNTITYYMGGWNDGSMKTGWVELPNEENGQYSWYYFEQDGEMIENQIDKKINGYYYTFANGKMQTGWYQVSSNTNSSSVAGYQYYLPSGARAEGWRNIEGVSGISAEDEFYWFYFNKGIPNYAADGIELFSIGSNKYGFNTKGEMQSGQKAVNLGNGETANFYFGSSDDGAMKTGQQTIYNSTLNKNQTWYFQTTGSKIGQGYHGTLDNAVYEYGLRKDN
jgi:glucan-binding YG repeat protein